MNLGKLLDVEIKMIENPKTCKIAQVTWFLEKGKISGGTISTSIIKGQKYWVQLPKSSFVFKGKKCWSTPLIISDKEVEDELFNAALKKFTGSESFEQSKAVFPESGQSEEINEEEIDLDDIPF